MDIAKFRKALVPVGVAVVVAALTKFGITPDMSVQDLVTVVVTLIVTAAGVYFTPNKK